MTDRIVLTGAGRRGPEGPIGPRGPEGPLSAEGIAARDQAIDSAAAALQSEQNATDISNIAVDDDIVEILVKPGAPGPKTKAALATSVNSTVAGQVLTSGLGTADDTAVIQGALDNPLVRTVTVPVGQVSQIAGTVTVPAQKTLTLAPSSRLVRTGASNSQVVKVSAGSTLNGGGVVDGNGVSTYTVGVLGNAAKITGVTIRGATYGVGSGGYDDVTVSECTFDTLTSYAALIEGTHARSIFRNNRVTGPQGIMFKGTGTAGAASGNIINLTGPTGVGIEVFGATMTLFTVTGNVVYGESSIGISLAAASLCTVAGNTVTGARLGIENAEGGSGNTITGNTVGPGISTSVGSGITVTTSNPTTKPLRNITVSGNTVVGSTLYGIEMTDCQGVNIVGNNIRNAVVRAIWVRGTANTGSIANNVAYSDLATAVNFIRVTGSNMRIADNVVYATATISGSEGLRIEGGSGGHLITGNYFTNVATGIGNNNSGTNIYDGNRTVGTTGAGINLYGAATNTTRVITHRGTIAGGSLVTNSGAAVIGMTVNNSVSATTLGTLSRKVEIFDGSGASLGFVPVYATIT